MRKKYLLIFLTGILILAVINYIGDIEQKRSEMRESLFVKLKKYQKYRNMATSREFLVKALEEREGLLSKLEAGLLPEHEENRARVFMQELVSSYADETGLTMVSLRTLDRIELKHYTGIPVQISIRGDMGRIAEFLQRFINSKYLITIDFLNIRVINIRDPYNVTLRGHFTGYIKKGEQL